MITARGSKGELAGNTASSFNSVSLDPPLVLWSLSRTALSLKAYIGSDHFAVNVLREGLPLGFLARRLSPRRHLTISAQIQTA